MTTAEIVIALATLCGPIAAVQVERYLARLREKQDRKLGVFRTLMATRASVLTADHVNAFNAIPIEFYGRKRVVDAWEAYFAHMHKDGMEMQVWGQRRIELMNNFLQEIGADLKYKFNTREMESVYSPKAFGAVENAQHTILHGMAELFRGNAPLRMEVTNLNGPNEDLNSALMKVLKGAQPLVMRREKDD